MSGANGQQSTELDELVASWLRDDRHGVRARAVAVLVCIGVDQATAAAAVEVGAALGGT